MHEFIEVKHISKKKGRGAFAKKNIKKGTIIDIANVILLPNSDYEQIQDTILYEYCYVWADPKHMPEFENAITMSISQFINHSFSPNVKYLYDYDEKAIEFTAIKDILKGEEITMNYNGLVDDKTPVWFDVVD
ncbi:MAG: SET domain-containing protein-lysine N-methyltransferase [Candidatus Lokiarchaeota archaeon]|nr:SET domain-containing protein-lysine N-methyltransferase [Candidatus Lokiarchaeota archaeon]